MDDFLNVPEGFCKRRIEYEREAWLGFTKESPFPGYSLLLYKYPGTKDIRAFMLHRDNGGGTLGFDHSAAFRAFGVEGEPPSYSCDADMEIEYEPALRYFVSELLKVLDLMRVEIEDLLPVLNLSAHEIALLLEPA